MEMASRNEVARRSHTIRMDCISIQRDCPSHARSYKNPSVCKEKQFLSVGHGCWHADCRLAWCKEGGTNEDPNENQSQRRRHLFYLYTIVVSGNTRYGVFEERHVTIIVI